VIKTVNLHKSFILNKKEKLHVLKGVNEHIQKGEVVSIVGPSGGGKSTFLRCLNLLETPEEGQIFFEGVEITNANVNINVHRQKMGMVFQHFNVFPHLTVKDNIMLAPVLLHKKSKAEGEELARELLNRVGLLEKINEHPARLSGGQKQRIAIARAVLRNAPILILDEATASVDVETEAEIQLAIGELAGSRTIIAIAHRLSTVRRADLILVFENGEIVQRGNHNELMAQDGLYRRLCRAQERGALLSQGDLA